MGYIMRIQIQSIDAPIVAREDLIAIAWIIAVPSIVAVWCRSIQEVVARLHYLPPRTAVSLRQIQR
jgi:hypothetical protein